MNTTDTFKSLARRVRGFTTSVEDNRTAPAVTLSQLLLAESYRQRVLTGETAIPFHDAGFSVFSQNEEDGLLLFLFTLLGTTNKVAVEICAGDGIECNAANLLVHHRWIGALFDGNADNIQRGRAFYNRQRNTRIWPPRLEQAWITRENVNQLLSAAGISGEIDMLSIDIDGNDYWVWDALTIIDPRVVVVEFNHLWGAEEALTIPYNPDFRATFTEYGSDYAGASLMAFVSLGREKGYRLIGTNAYATNAFFVRNNLHHAWLPQVLPSSCFAHPRAQFGIKHRLPLIRDRDWLSV